MNGDVLKIEVADGGWILEARTRHSDCNVTVYTDLAALIRAVANRVGYGHTLKIESADNGPGE